MSLHSSHVQHEDGKVYLQRSFALFSNLRSSEYILLQTNVLSDLWSAIRDQLSHLYHSSRLYVSVLESAEFSILWR